MEPEVEHWYQRLGIPYIAKRVPEVDINNTPRIYRLIRAGNIYLSLADAIALTLENNLDVQVSRYQPRMSQTDLLRAKGGGTLRGVGLSAPLLPSGIGGPASPLLTNAATGSIGGSAVPNEATDLTFLQSSSSSVSVDPGTGSSPFPSASGPPIPLYDPAIAGALLWNKQKTPQATSF